MVGQNVPEAKAYLLENGIDTITALTREDGAVVRKVIPLQD